jgi:hypothetical protein
MKRTRALFFLALLSGCAHTATKDFVQGNIRISPPIQKDTTAKYTLLSDGGTQPGMFTDTNGKSFDYYIDHSIGTTTPGAIYLNAPAGEPGSVRIRNEAEFRQKLGF